MHILLVEDDLPLALGLQEALSRQDYVINHVETGNACLHVIDTEPPDILVLDLGLPDLDGLTVLKKIRQKTTTLPVLLLTARDSADDKVSGLDTGADDYLVKPFEMVELLARLRVLERRLNVATSNVIRIGDVSLDTTAHLVLFKNNEIDLSRKEYMLLKLLMTNAGKVQTRSKLENRLYSWGEEVSSNAMEVHIHHLRKKLGTDFIKTIRGVGYKVENQ